MLTHAPRPSAEDTITDLEFEALTWPLGAQVHGLDLTQVQPEAVIAALHQALANYGVLLFREQAVSLDEQLRFCRQIGPLSHMPSAYRTGMHPDYSKEVYIVTNEPRPDGSPSPTLEGGRGWHYDQIFMASPNMARVLHCVTAPALGATTLLSNQALAYEALSAPYRRLIDDLTACYDRSLINRDRGIPLTEADKNSLLAAHAVVRTHPVSGRKALFVQRQAFTRFEGMTADESMPIVQFLHAHQTQPTFTYRHFWKPGDTLMWDNRFVMHLAPPDYDVADVANPANRRIMRGITIG